MYGKVLLLFAFVLKIVEIYLLCHACQAYLVVTVTKFIIYTPLMNIDIWLNF